MIARYFFLTAALFCLASHATFAASYYVDGNIGNDGWAGTDWTTARATISAGDGLLGAGDVLLVRGDCVYREQVSVPVSGTGWDNMAVYQGVPGTNGGALPVVTGGVDLDETAFRLESTNQYTYVYDLAANYYRVYEQTGPDTWIEYTSVSDTNTVEATPASAWVYNTPGDAIYIHTSDGSDPTNFVLEIAAGGNIFGIGSHSFVKIAGFHMRHTLGDGVAVDNAESCEISDNVIYSLTRGGVGCFDAPGGRNCRVHDNVFRDAGNGVWLRSANDIEIYHNTFYGNGSAFYLDDVDSVPLTNVLIHANTIYSNGLAGDIDASVDMKIWNNVVYGNTTAGFYLNAGGSHNAEIYNNTFYDNALYCILLNVATNATVFNNIFWPAAGGRGIYINTSATNGFASGYNCFYAPDGHAGYWLSANTTSLEDWQASSGQDGTSVSADPDFVSTDAGALNLLINDDSPCRDFGTDLFEGVSAPGVDIAGESRPRNARTDIGAYEASVPAGTLFLIR